MSQNFLPIAKLVKGSKLPLAAKVINSGTEDFELRNEQRLEGSMARSFPAANPNFGLASVDFQPSGSHRSLHNLSRFLGSAARANHSDVIKVSENLT